MDLESRFLGESFLYKFILIFLLDVCFREQECVDNCLPMGTSGCCKYPMEELS